MTSVLDLVRINERGLYCEAGDFYIDPWRPVTRAVITHGHSDHARSGSGSYLAHSHSRGILRLRLGEDAVIETLEYGETISLGGVKLSLHPAGHILGSSQVRLEYGGQVWVISGDYKTQSDPTCPGIEPVACHCFITESTFGLPIYDFPSSQVVYHEINSWWRKNKEAGRISLLYAYSLGKAQRIIAGLEDIAPIYTHGAVEALNQVYRGCGVSLPATTHYSAQKKERMKADGAIIIAPPNAQDSAWARKFGASEAFASGWMRVRGARRRRALDRGFVMSDHADWRGLIDTIKATGAGRVLVTHGYAHPLIRYLSEQGLEAAALETAFAGEGEAAEVAADEHVNEEAALPDADVKETGGSEGE